MAIALFGKVLFHGFLYFSSTCINDTARRHLPVMVNVVLFFPVFPLLSVALQVWMPVSPE